MDLKPFGRINPCGYAGLEVTSTSVLGLSDDPDTLAADFNRRFADALGYRLQTGVGSALRD